MCYVSHEGFWFKSLQFHSFATIFYTGHSFLNHLIGMALQITHSSKCLCSNGLSNLASVPFWRPFPTGLPAGHQFKSHGSFLFSPTHWAHLYRRACAGPTTSMAWNVLFSRHPSGSPLTPGRCPPVRGDLPWQHSPYPALFPSVVFIATWSILCTGLLSTHTATHMNGSWSTGLT